MHSIQNATVADISTIIHIAHDTWWPTYGAILSAEQIGFMLDAIYSIEKITQQITTGEQQFILLKEDGTPVAFAASSPREEDREVYKLHKLYCLPKTQGKGYGRILINEIVNRVKQAGKTYLDLNVNRYNNARSFYEKLGFEVIYEEDVPIGPYWMNDFVMRKRV
jgi:GNAT superfamily N-acetyltransferase